MRTTIKGRGKAKAGQEESQGRVPLTLEDPFILNVHCFLNALLSACLGPLGL